MNNIWIFFAKTEDWFSTSNFLFSWTLFGCHDFEKLKQNWWNWPQVDTGVGVGVGVGVELLWDRPVLSSLQFTKLFFSWIISVWVFQNFGLQIWLWYVWRNLSILKVKFISGQSACRQKVSAFMGRQLMWKDDGKRTWQIVGLITSDLKREPNAGIKEISVQGEDHYFTCEQCVVVNHLKTQLPNKT